MKVSPSLAKLIGSMVCFTVFVCMFGSCIKDDDPAPASVQEDSTKVITSFTFIQAGTTSLDPKEVSVVIKNDSILVAVPVGIDLTQIKPAITYEGVILMPSGSEVQDFSKPVTYTVTAEDGSTRKYVVVAVHVPLRNRVFIGGDASFYALDAVTGDLKWEFTSSGSFYFSTPTCKDSIVYVGCNDLFVYAFHATTGKLIWKFKAGTTGVLCSVTASGNTLYIGNDDHEFYALDAQTGSVKWKFMAAGEVRTTSTVVNGIVYFGCADKNVYAINATTGDLIWKYTTGGSINESGPAVVNGILYAGSADHFLYAINAATGALTWKYDIGVAILNSSPTVVNGVVYIAGSNNTDLPKWGGVYAVNAATGTLVWEALANAAFNTSPVVWNGSLFISGGGNFYALNTSNGSPFWSKKINSLGSSAAVANGLVFTGDGGSRYVYAYNAVSGEEKWKFALRNNDLLSGVMVLDSLGVAYYSSGSGMVQ